MGTRIQGPQAALESLRRRRQQPQGVQLAQDQTDDRPSVEERGEAITGRLRQGLQQGLQQGRERGAQIFGPGSLGRLQPSQLQNIIDQAQQTAPLAQRLGAEGATAQDILARRQAALGGLSAPENQALREQATQGLNRRTQTALRALRGQQGATGITGGTALAQQADILRGQQQAQAGLERDLLLENVAQRQRALDALEATQQGQFQQGLTGQRQALQDFLAAQQAETGIQQFNIGQEGREAFGRLGTELGFGGLEAGLAGAGVQGALAERGQDLAARQLAALQALGPVAEAGEPGGLGQPGLPGGFLGDVLGQISTTTGLSPNQAAALAALSPSTTLGTGALAACGQRVFGGAGSQLAQLNPLRQDNIFG